MFMYMQNTLFLCSRQSFDVARVLAAVGVFLCHAFYSVHEYFGIFTVVPFFFMSGFGMEITHSRLRSLIRLPRFIAVFLFFALVYYFVYGVWYYPTAWYLFTYMLLMLLYRFLGDSLVKFFLSYLVVFGLMFFLDFEYNYWLYSWGFLFGYFVARHRLFFSCKFSLHMMMFFFIFFFYPHMIWFVFLYPMFLTLFFRLSSMSFFAPLSSLAPLVFPFFSVHCWFLGLFAVTWTLGGDSFSLIDVVLSFLLSLLAAYLLNRYVPIFSKKKFWIFQ